MELDEEDDEDLLATLESVPPSAAAPSTVEQPQAPLPPAAAADDIDMSTPEISIAQVLGKYRTSVVPDLKQLHATFEQARQQQVALAAAAESMLDAFASASSSSFSTQRQGHQHFIEQLRNLQVTQDLLLALVEWSHVQMRCLLNNEIYNHMVRGPQTTPFRAAEGIEPTEIAFKIDNPELAQKPDAPPVVTRRPAFFM
jgi:hypothetical protein